MEAGPGGSGSGPGDDTWPFAHERTVEFGDLDALAHVNNVIFLRYFESARIAFVASLAPEVAVGRDRELGFMFAECHINYRSQARYGERIVTRVRVGEVHRSAFRVEFRMDCAEDDRLVADGYGVLVAYDHKRGESRGLPDWLRERLEQAR